MKASFVTILLATVISTAAFAHGMNKPGPNNGYVRMPSTYHIELVSSKNILKIYFLDMSFKAIPITNATVKMSLKGLKTDSVVCTKEAEFFSCDLKEVNLKNYKEILVESTKAQEKGVASTFKLPLAY